MSQTMVENQSGLAYNWLELLREASLVALDTETNTLRLHEKGARVNGFSLCIKRGKEYIAEYFPTHHVRGTNLPVDIWGPILALACTKTVVAHNLNFDRKACNLLGVSIGKGYDLPRICHLYDENSPSNYKLETLCAHYKVANKVKSVEFETYLTVFGWDRIAPSEIREYATADAVAAYQLFEYVAPRLKKREPAVFDEYYPIIEAPNFNVLYDMKELGVGVDIEFCKEWEERCYVKMAEIEADLGFDPGKPTNLKRVLHDELGLPVITAKKTGKPTFDRDAMERYEVMLERLENPLAQKVMAHRGWKGAVTRYYGPYQEHVYSDQRIRPGYLSHGTVTGRFACSEPNLQQIPKESDKPWNGRVKECFIPLQDHELWEFDYSQLELRLGASYGRDEKLLSVFNDPIERDLFSEMAAELGWPRQKVKTFVYSINYGAGAQRIMDVFGCSREQAQRYIREFYESYEGLRRINDYAKSLVAKTGYLELWSGRRRHFDDPRSQGFKGFNSLIQGGSADLVKNVMNRLHTEMPELRILLQVHDSLWFEIPTARREEYKSAIKSIMDKPFANYADMPERVQFKVEGSPVGGKNRWLHL